MKRLLLAFVLLVMSSLGMAAVNINTATKEQLEALVGVGPVKAQAIIDYRRANGRFKSLDELKNVKGFGDATVDNLKGEIALTGASSTPKATSEPAKSAAPGAAKAEPTKMAAPAPAPAPAPSPAKSEASAKADAAKAKKEEAPKK